MQNEQNSLKTIFQRIFTGTASRKEKKRIARWLSDLDISERELTFDEVERQRLQFQVNFQQHINNQPREKAMFRFSTWISVAAAAIIIITTGMFFLMRPQRDKEISYTIAFAGAGERKIVTLADGSKITLNNLSRIKFPQVFTDSIREVYLEGEAFFQVAHNKKKPFIVKTGKLRVQVLGTSFDIRNYRDEDKIDVTVSTGKVGVVASGKKEYNMLTPGQQLSYDRTTGRMDQSDVVSEDYSSWQHGELIFRNEPLEVICKRLERWYGVKIAIRKPALKSRKISLEQKNENLQNVLKMLAIVGGFKYEINDKDVSIW